MAEYRRSQPGSAGGDDAWASLFDELDVAGDGLAALRERVQRQTVELSTGLAAGDAAQARPWPVSPLPLLIDAAEWSTIERGVVQRAELLERVTADLYGAAALVADGTIPAAMVAGSPHFLRPMVGVAPPGGRHLRFVAIDLARTPAGCWLAMADHLRAPAGAGHALENRLATVRALPGLYDRLNIRRHAPFFAALRAGLASACRRTEPRIGLLTPGRANPGYAEQALLARYLGMLLVEGGDLAAPDGRLYVRTIGGLKRIDALWRAMDARLLDPLALDSRSQIGTAGLIDAYAGGELMLANAPGAGVLEAPAFAALMPQIAQAVLGEPLRLPSPETWWCGRPADARIVNDGLNRLLVVPAFGAATLGLDGLLPVSGATLDEQQRARVQIMLDRRPQDLIGRVETCLSTMPAIDGEALVTRPFTLRVFAARSADDGWTVLPGGFARIGTGTDPRASRLGEGGWSADVCVHGPDQVAPVSLLTPAAAARIRRNPGTLPSRVADDFFWLGRYLERGETVLASVRVLLGTGLDADAARLPEPTLARLAGLLVAGEAAPAPAGLRRSELVALATCSLGSPDHHSVATILALARTIGEGARDRLSADMVQLLDSPFPVGGALADRAEALQRRFLAIAGLISEQMGRTAAWRFLDLGRRMERGAAVARATAAFAMAGATAQDLSTLLDLANSQISYRQRYPAGLSRVGVVDLVALDPGNPRGLAFQAAAIAEHVAALPVLSDDGMAEPQQAVATRLAALVATADARMLDAARLGEVETRLAELSNAVSQRYFLHGAEPLRAGGLTLA